MEMEHNSPLGDGEGTGFNINIPLPQGTGDRGYLKSWDCLVEPIAEEFAPDIILLSAGFDAHQNDPIGGQQVSSVGFYLLSKRLAEMSRRLNAPIAGVLEGGYNTEALADSVLNTLIAFSGFDEAAYKDIAPNLITSAENEYLSLCSDSDSAQVDKKISKLSRHFSEYWDNLR